ncbi:MAG: hypothetical protein ACLFMO_05270 [Eubacteriales bacterium]
MSYNMFSGTRVYINKQYRVMFNFPNNWKPSEIAKNRFEGSDGFFQVSLISSNKSIDEVAKHDAYHSKLPYGRNPEIKKRFVNGHEARLITPDRGETDFMEKQAAIIVEYDKPLAFNNNKYNYLIIWSDVYNIMGILRSLKILPV